MPKISFYRQLNYLNLPTPLFLVLSQIELLLLFQFLKKSLFNHFSSLLNAYYYKTNVEGKENISKQSVVKF